MRVVGPYRNRVRYSTYEELTGDVGDLVRTHGRIVTLVVPYLNFARKAAKAIARLEPDESRAYCEGLMAEYLKSPRIPREMLEMILARIAG